MKLTEELYKLYHRKTYLKRTKDYGVYRLYRDQFLKDKVSGQGERTQRAVCLAEMSAMLNCLSLTEYDIGPCSKEIAAFKKCDAEAETERSKRKEIVKCGGGITEEGTRQHRLAAAQVNQLLRRFPTPTPKEHNVRRYKFTRK